MKQLTRYVGLIASASLLTAGLGGCTSETEFGKCVGLGEDQRPELIYKVSKWNVFLAVIGFELIAPPIYVVVNQTFCPVGKRKDQ